MISRRQRYLALGWGGATLFLLLVAGVLWIRSGKRETYVPGEKLEGLTNTLARTLPDDRPDVTFVDVTDSAGIHFRHFPGVRTSRLPEDMGSGAAWGDYDRDGWLDLFVVNQSGPMTLTPEQLAASDAHATLYHNRGDGTFEDVSAAAGVDWRGTGMGVAWGDYDGDGWPDILMTTYGGLVLYRNRGDGTFEDATARAGLARFKAYWTGVAWADYDGDGDLDAYVGGYVRFEDRPNAPPSKQYDIEQPTSLNPSAFDPEPNLLLRNNGDGTFTDVAREAGVADVKGRSLSVAWADLDEDGRPDLYVANDLSDNVLYHNLGDGTFEETSHMAGVADYRGAMGLAVGDWNGDGDLDLFITHWLAQENALYDNDYRRRAGEEPGPNALLRFMDVADRYGLGQIGLDFVGWGTSFFDYDNDGRPDLLVVNGSTIQEKDSPTLLVPMHDLMLWNAGPERGFYDVSSVAGPYFERKLVGRGATFGDYDNDGDVDVFIVSNAGPGILLRNDGGDEKAWIEIALEGRGHNRSAIGARVREVADGVAQVREVRAQPSYLSQNSPVVHFGLGQATEVDTLQVRWPSGAVQTFTGLAARSRYRLVEGREPAATGVAGEAAETATDTTSTRESVQAFWASYRQATRQRVAGEREAAAADYRKALALNPRHEDALYYLGNVLFDLDSLAAAREAFTKLVEVNPESARGHSRLGILYLCTPGLGPARLDSAEHEFRTASSLYRIETGSWVRLAETAFLKGDDAAATRAAETALGSNRQSPQAHFFLGYMAWREGREAQAREHFRSAVEGASSVTTMTESANPCDAALSMSPYLASAGDSVDVSLMGERYRDFDNRLSGLRRSPR